MESTPSISFVTIFIVALLILASLSSVLSKGKSKSWGSNIALFLVVAIGTIILLRFFQQPHRVPAQNFRGQLEIVDESNTVYRHHGSSGPGWVDSTYAQPQPVQVVSRESIATRFVVFLVVPLLGILAYFALKKSGGRHSDEDNDFGLSRGSNAWPWIAAGLLPFAFCWFFISGTRQSVEQQAIVVAENAPSLSTTRKTRLVPNQETDSGTAYNYAPVQEYNYTDVKETPDTEQLWQQITKSRIELDEKESSAAEEQEIVEETVAVTASEEEVTDEDENSLVLTSAKSTKTQRPDWVDNPPKRIGNIYRQVLSSEPYSSVPECHRELDKQIKEVVQERIKQLTAARYIPSLDRLNLGLDSIFRDFCQEEWVEVVDASFGDMKRVHLLMEFDQQDDRRLKETYMRYERRDALEIVIAIFATLLCGIALFYGLLKVDTWTRGYYSKRLLFGVPAAIILFFVFLAMVVD